MGVFWVDLGPCPLSYLLSPPPSPSSHSPPHSPSFYYSVLLLLLLLLRCRRLLLILLLLFLLLTVRLPRGDRSLKFLTRPETTLSLPPTSPPSPSPSPPSSSSSPSFCSFFHFLFISSLFLSALTNYIFSFYFIFSSFSTPITSTLYNIVQRYSNDARYTLTASNSLYKEDTIHYHRKKRNFATTKRYSPFSLTT